MKTNNAKISAKIQELKNEFLRLQADEGFEFAPDTDGFIEWLAGKLSRAESIFGAMDHLQKHFLIGVNDYLTNAKMAEHYGVSEELNASLLLAGRDIHEAQFKSNQKSFYEN